MSDVTTLKSGTRAPTFALKDVLSNEEVSLASLRGQIVVINFWSVECPWSRRYDQYFIERARTWGEAGIRLLFIDSNHHEAIYEMQDLAEELGIENPILCDAGNVAADAYGAVTTPHIFVIDADGFIAYQGAVDDQSFRQQEATVHYLDAALDALRRGESPDPADTLPYGCAIVRDYGDG
jgi:peroxiredoxin